MQEAIERHQMNLEKSNESSKDLDNKQMNGILGTKQRLAEIDNESKSRDDDFEL